MSCFFFFNDTATTEIYTLSLHDALPISKSSGARGRPEFHRPRPGSSRGRRRSEEHTSELQSRFDLVCRLLLEKKKKKKKDLFPIQVALPPYHEQPIHGSSLVYAHFRDYS